MNKALLESQADEDLKVLRDRFQQWGYLYFRNYVGSRECDDLLTDILQQTAPYIQMDPQRQRAVLDGEPFFETDSTWDEIYPKIQSLESFHSFFHSEPVKQLMQVTAGEDVFVYPMKMARI